jgi:hypothetical protein
MDLTPEQVRAFVGPEAARQLHALVRQQLTAEPRAEGAS